MAILQIKWVTRNARDYTDRYGPVLDPHIIRGVSAHRCILDGEVRREAKVHPLAHIALRILTAGVIVYMSPVQKPAKWKISPDHPPTGS